MKTAAWYHRELSIPDHWNGTGYANFYTMIAFDGGFYGTATAYFDNICILDTNGNVVEYFFDNGGEEYNYENNVNVVKGGDYSFTNYKGVNAEVVLKSEVPSFESKVDNIIEKIEALPSFRDITADNREEVNEIISDYNKLNDTEKEQVNNISKLYRCKARLDAIDGLFKYGDIDKNGKVDSSDALQVLQYSVNKISLDYNQYEAARVGGDSSITSSDALYVLQMAVKKIVVFPVEQ